MGMASAPRIELATAVIASQRVARTRARCQAPRSNPALSPRQRKLDCFVALLLAMTGKEPTLRHRFARRANQQQTCLASFEMGPCFRRDDHEHASKPPARKIEFVEPDQADLGRPVPSAKINPFPSNPNHF